MLDIALIRRDPDGVKAALHTLNDAAAAERIDDVLRYDEQRRAAIAQAEALQAGRNKLNRAMGHLRGDKATDAAAKASRLQAAAQAVADGDPDRAEALLGGTLAAPATADAGVDDAMAAFSEALKALGARYDALMADVKTVEAALDDAMLWLPNLPHASVPVAADESGNVPHPPEGLLPEFDFAPRPHWELGPALGLIDFERGVRIAGSRGYVLAGWGARLQRALVQLFLANAHAHGYTEVYVPYLVRGEMMVGSAQFPKFADAVYRVQDSDTYLLPTAEVAITNLHRDDILEEAALPLRYVAHTPCFRQEQFSAGRDVRGIKRVHQFEKVELYQFTTPEASYDALEAITQAASAVLRALELPFRRLEIATGDLGFAATKKYDLEVYSAGTGEWLEVSSCSNTEAFQARRANVRYRPSGSKKTEFVHTLNGSGLAVPRVLIALLENNQQADGSILVPKVLRPYLGGTEVIAAGQG